VFVRNGDGVVDGDRDYVVPSWDQVYDMTLGLAFNVRSSSFKPELIVGISRGGWIPGRLLSDLLVDVRTANVKIEYYDGFVNRRRVPTVTQQLSAEELSGKKVLVVDDIVDSGESLKVAVMHINDKGASVVRTATMYYKPSSTFRPDFYACETTGWVVFPWERLELTQLLLREKQDIQAVMETLTGIGLDEKIVKVLLELAERQQ
jgi:hypoxanthine phosphoribosyltransferase